MLPGYRSNVSGLPLFYIVKILQKYCDPLYVIKMLII